MHRSERLITALRDQAPGVEPLAISFSFSERKTAIVAGQYWVLHRRGLLESYGPFPRHLKIPYL